LKKIVLGALALAAIGAAPVLAADLPVKAKAPAVVPPATYNWTGFYIGGNVGYGWYDRSSTLVAPDATSVTFFGPALAAGALPAAYGINPSGAIGGVQAGYNWQFNNVVVGLEADFQGSGVKGSTTLNTTVAPFNPITATATERLDYFGTARGRLGYAANTALFYVTGGLAYGHVNHSFFTASPLNPQSAGGSSGQDNVGYAIGAGVEWAFNKNWSVKGEYLYVDLGNASTTATGITGTPAGATLILSERDKYNIVRVGVNYKFSGPVVAKY
jgi:outer membrane immunogenic protein